MKRTSPDGSDDPDDSQSGGEEICTKRRRYCEFEPIRLHSIASVHDIEEKKCRVQVYKLSETLRHKDKIIADKDREIERLRERQYTDENTSYTINRYWNNLDEQLRSILLRGSNPSDVQHLLEANGDASSNFLEEVVQMSEDERQKIYDKRVHTSVRILQQILQSNQQRAEQLKAFTGKLNAFMSDVGSREDALNETVHMNGILTEENARLTKEVTRLQTKNTECKLKLRESVDRISILETKNDEQLKEISDLRHDLNKANRLVNKLDFKLYNEVKDRRKMQNSISESHNEPQQNGAPPPGDVPMENENNGCDAKLLEEIRFEAETNAELAANRLNEINELNEKIRRQAEELQRAKLLAEVPVLNDHESEETKEIKVYLTLMIEEVRRKQNAEVALLEEMDLLREDHSISIQNLQQTYDRTVKKLEVANERLQKESEASRTEADNIRNEYEMAIKSIVNSGTPENKDIKTLKDSYKAQGAQTKSELNRMRKKWKESVNAFIKVTNELNAEKTKNKRFYLVPIVPAEEEYFPENPNLEQLRCRFTELKHENNCLRQEIKALKEMEDITRRSILEGEFKNLLDEKDSTIASLNTKIECLNQGDESITAEMESIGQALEDLQEQNADLIRRTQHHEEEKMKMMGDKISSSQIEAKLKEEKAQLELKLDHLKHQLQAAQTERQHLDDTYKNLNAAFSTRTKETTLLRSSIEIFKKQTLEKTLELSQLKTDKEKLSAQVKSMQETVISKNQQYDIIAQKVRRLEEENSVVKKKLDRLKRCEKLGSTDAVLGEEIRQLKEALTCPSCKVNRKDAILTKCFHVFCMKCLKTRYDTRQRKCPKCNAGFGANDFQRAYIG